MIHLEQEPYIAVLLAAYNGRKWLDEQLDTILSQSKVRIKIFISLDLSHDGSDTVINQYAERYKSVVFMPYGERFGNAGANFFRLIRDVNFHDFDAIAFSDQDDIWFPDKLYRAWKRLEGGFFQAYSSNVIARWGNNKRKIIKKSQKQKELDYFFESAGPGCTYVFNKCEFLYFQRFIIEHKEFLQKKIIIHDWLAYAFYRNRRFRWFIDSAPSMYYRQHEANQIGVNYGWQAYVTRWRAIKNQEYRQQVNNIAKLIDPEKLKNLNDKYFLIRSFFSLRRRMSHALLLLIALMAGIY